MSKDKWNKLINKIFFLVDVDEDEPQQDDHQYLSRVTRNAQTKKHGFSKIVISAICIGILITLIFGISWEITNPISPNPNTTQVVESTSSISSSYSDNTGADTATEEVDGNSDSTSSILRSSANTSSDTSSVSTNADTNTNTNTESGHYLATIVTTTGNQSQRFSTLNDAMAWCKEQLSNGTATNYKIITD